MITPSDPRYHPQCAAPTTWEADVVLADGAVAILRPVRAGDAPAMVEFYAGVSEESKFLRFFGTHPELNDEDLRRWLAIDHATRVTLVIEEKERIIGTARFELVPQLLPAKVGDVSFLVQDAHQGRGVANILLEHLAHIGRELGVERFFAEMLTHNRSMVAVFRRAGYAVAPQLEDGFIVVDFPIDPTAASRDVMLQREHRSEAAAIRRMLHPRSVAVVGRVDTMEGIIASVVGGGYQGTLRMITCTRNTAAEALDSIAEDVDLVVVQYEPDTLGDVLAATARKNAHGVVVLARGQNPILDARAAREFVAHARAHGVRALGPASLGMLTTDPAVRLNATAAPMPRAGAVGLFTQSAGVATLALARATTRQVGVSNFIATGAFADVTANDVIQFWFDDAHTRICLLSLDAIGNPRKFFRVLRRLALEKHVVIFTPSRALSSARRSEHLPEATPGALDEVIGQAGAMVVSQRDTMYDVATILARQPVPRGPRVAVVSNSAGLNEQMVAAGLRFGLEPQATTIGGDPAAGVLRAAEEQLRGEVDAVVAAIVEISEPVFEEVYAGLSLLAETSPIPLIGVFVGFRSPPQPDITVPEGPGQLPVFEAYAEPLEALSLIVANERRRAAARPHPDDTVLAGDRAAARALIAETCGWLDDHTVVELLATYGITVVPWQPVGTLDEAVDAASAYGWDVVLKATSPVVRGRPELATIARGIRDREAMATAWRHMGRIAADIADTGTAGLGLTVQPEVPAGSSWTLRAIEDPVLGPMISVGGAGLASDLLGDTAWRVPPLRPQDARSMLLGLRAAPLLTGYRGTRPADIDGLVDVLQRLAALKDDHPSIVEVELTPVIAAAATTSVVGARVRVAPLPEERDPLARNLETP
ncbi:GNAT family N-acetyltransferase [Corynebacterium sp. 13CS0277]|uniref:GNAT family N-acetyltransferase n=1 Tax=Corynebacterium sp. 13CS0277 TaxID=2071994 RepID=UPI000D02B52B|nr:GNAT family N-acetyltransferase [Corynebacterium sp. 13CS0277]PRQ11281.1 GNAT family N-acetyltransferase [Corynebacterium sp. 13CS0277]